MGLIKKYGGYAKAKAKLDTLDKRLYGARALKVALLQYRREHGIFEVGDWFVSDTVLKPFKIIEKTRDYLKLWCEEHTAEFSGNAETITGIFRNARHATDEEIKAQRRLDDEPKWGRAVELERLNQITITSTPSGEAPFYDHALAEAKRNGVLITWDPGRDITNELNGDKVD